MTWLADNENSRASGDVREKLLVQRQNLVDELAVLRVRPTGKSEAAKRFDREEMNILAKKILNIDKKLGRAQV
jgi:hypothetical protein